MTAWRLLLWREAQQLWHRMAYWVITGIMAVGLSGLLAGLPLLRHAVPTRSWAVQAPPAVIPILHTVLNRMAAAHDFAIRWVPAARAALVIQTGTGSTWMHRIILDVRQWPAPPATWITRALTPVAVTQRLKQHHVPLAAHALLQPPVVHWRFADALPPAPAASQVALTMGLVLVIFFLLSMYSQILGETVATEKASRLSELLSIRIAPSTLLWGKWAGVGVAAMTQVIIGLAVSGAVILLDPAAAAMVHAWHVSAASWSVWLAALWGFMLGFLFYGAIFLWIGAGARRPEDSRGTAGIALIIMAFAYSATFYALSHTTSVLTQWLSVLPPFFPLLIIVRQGYGSATGSEWLFGSALTLLSGGGLLWLAARRYRRTLYAPARRSRHRRSSVS